MICRFAEQDYMRKYSETVTYWCSVGNSIPEQEKNPGKSLALVPCKRETCPEWEPGPERWCVHLERVDKKLGRI